MTCHDFHHFNVPVEQLQRYALPLCSLSYCLIMNVARSHEVINFRNNNEPSRSFLQLFPGQYDNSGRFQRTTALQK